MTCCWIIPLLVGLLCALLGYLLGRLCGKGKENWEERYHEVNRNWEQCKKRRIELENELKDSKDAKADTNAFADLQKKYDSLEVQLARTNESNKVLTSELAVKDYSIAQLNQKINLLGTAAAVAFNADAAKAVFEKKIKENDLTIVEGIGPKIQELFHKEGIKTWKALSETKVEKCKEILEKSGPNFAVHTPTTWPKQAGLAYEGKWKELKKWQDELDGGK